jgi:HAD superfamily hydrolase (TIGR01459 family)
MPEPPIPRQTRVILGLGEIADRYDAILCDVWGVLHNGRESFRLASDALVAFRRRGGVVVLITNAPRPSPPIRAQVVSLGVSLEAFDEIVTSGDVTVALIVERGAAPVHHIGPPRDLSLFEEAEAQGARPRLVPLEEASYVLCTGLFDDDVETPDDYEHRLSAMAARNMPFICANPDLVVHRGATLIYCAGALAKRYEELGGAAIYAGKPHAPIYRVATAAAESVLRRPLAASRALCVGDAMRTDIAGAAGQGFDALFISAGIHGHELHVGGRADPARLEALFARENLWPFATAGVLSP